MRKPSRVGGEAGPLEKGEEALASCPGMNKGAGCAKAGLVPGRRKVVKDL